MKKCLLVLIAFLVIPLLAVKADAAPAYNTSIDYFDNIDLFPGWEMSSGGVVASESTKSWTSSTVWDLSQGNSASAYMNQGTNAGRTYIYGGVALGTGLNPLDWNVTGLEIFDKSSTPSDKVDLFSLRFQPGDGPTSATLNVMGATAVGGAPINPLYNFALVETAPGDRVYYGSSKFEYFTTGTSNLLFSAEAFVYYDLNNDYFLFAIDRLTSGAALSTAAIRARVYVPTSPDDAERGIGYFRSEAAAVPEPASLLILGTAAFAGLGLKRFRRKTT